MRRVGIWARCLPCMILTATGPFGYTVRVLPRNPHLAHPAELGRIALPPA